MKCDNLKKNVDRQNFNLKQKAAMNNHNAVDSLIKEMDERIAAVMLDEAVSGVIPRFNQPKTVAYLDAEFRVHDDIPTSLKQGVFSQPVTYPAKLRFANATKHDDSKKDIRGLSIRLSNVKGEVCWGETGLQDFILNSYPALFVATPEEFLEFIRARQAHKMLLFFLHPFYPHLKSLWIAFKANKIHLSPLDVCYWSTTPYRLGSAGNQVVKYSVIPASSYRTTEVVASGQNQLRAAVKAHLSQGPAQFQFAVQLQTDPNTMPIEDASVIWDEKLSPFIPVATIKINPQDVDSPDVISAGERSSFNPWQCLIEHQPLGRMNHARRLIYANAAARRIKGQ